MVNFRLLISIFLLSLSCSIVSCQTEELISLKKVKSSIKKVGQVVDAHFMKQMELN